MRLLRNEAGINSTEDDYLTDDDDEDENDDDASDSEDDDDDYGNNSALLENETFSESVENVVISTFGQGENQDNFSVTIRCAAHSIQLSVMDTLKTTRIKNILKKSRKVVKKLRTSTMRLQLQKEGEKKPIIDSKIRWNSQYNMLYRLVELKSFCIKYENVTTELKLSDTIWEEINNILEALKPIKILTRQVQSVQMTLSDFYGFYVKCRLLLFISNNILLAAVYLDPRYQILLSQEDRKNAQKHLYFLHKQIHSRDDDSAPASVIPNSEMIVEIHDHELEFESFLSQIEFETNARSQVVIETGKCRDRRNTT